MPLERLNSSSFNMYDDDTILKLATVHVKNLLYSDSSKLKTELHVMWRFQWKDKNNKSHE